MKEVCVYFWQETSPATRHLWGITVFYDNSLLVKHFIFYLPVSNVPWENLSTPDFPVSGHEKSKNKTDRKRRRKKIKPYTIHPQYPSVESSMIGARITLSSFFLSFFLVLLLPNLGRPKVWRFWNKQDSMTYLQLAYLREINKNFLWENIYTGQ